MTGIPIAPKTGRWKLANRVEGFPVKFIDQVCPVLGAHSISCFILIGTVIESRAMSTVGSWIVSSCNAQRA